jgi:hypothetical protein
MHTGCPPSGHDSGVSEVQGKRILLIVGGGIAA